MTPTTLHNPKLPTEQDIRIATETSRKLAKMISKGPSILRLKMAVKNGETLEIPTSMAHMILDMLEQTANGKAVTIIPFNTEMTTQQAADFLNVSRPFFIQLLEKNQIPFYKVGTHRRIHFKDVLNYKTTIDNKRRETLNALAKQAQELDMGY